jgi:hypothetical protein
MSEHDELTETNIWFAWTEHMHYILLLTQSYILIFL